MISTKAYRTWAKDPDAPELIISVNREIGGGTINFTFRVPAPERELNPNLPIKIQRLFKKVIRVWQ